VTAQEQARNAKRGGCFLGDTAYRARILSELDPERTARIDEMRKAQLAADGLQSEDIEHNFTISPAARRELIQRGVRCFKLQGRDLVHSSFQAKVVDFLEKVVRDEL
jgi:hypothetical protein